MVDLTGLYDLHVHAAPCSEVRSQDARAVLNDASAAGLAGVVFKSPHIDTAGLAAALDDGSGTRPFGGVVLNKAVGGINPYAVEATLTLQTVSGMKPGRIVWLPTRHSDDHIGKYGPANLEPVTLWVEGTTQPRGELLEVLDIIAAKDAVLATGHLGFPQVERLVPLAQGRGVSKILVTHAETGPVSLTIDEQRYLAERGVYIEHSYSSTLNGPGASDPRLRTRDGASIQTMVADIRAAGVKACVMTTDYGSEALPKPIDGFRSMIDALDQQGVTDDEIRLMTRTNPEHLLGVA